MQNGENMEKPETASEEQQAGDAAHTIAAKAEEMAREFRDAARAKAEDRVHELGGKAQHRIDDERGRVASRIEDVASRIRERGQSGGPVGVAGERVAVRMDAAAGYLHGHETSEIAGDVSAFVHAHPVKAVIAAGFVGFVFGRLSS